MFSLFGRRSGASQKIIAILDIGSGSVGGAVGRLDTAGKPTLLFSVREDFPFRMTRTAKELASDAAGAAKSVLDKVKKAAALMTEKERVTPLKIEHVAVFLASPWSTTELRTLRLSRTKPFTVNADTLRRMLADEARTVASHIKPQTRIIERIATGLLLNGYEAQELSSAPVTSAEVTLAATVAPEAFIDLLEDAMGEPPRGAERTYHSFALPACHALSLYKPEMRDALIVDAGAEVTEMIVMRGGAPAALATSPMGHHLLLRTLKSRAGMGKQEGITTLKLAEADGTRLSEIMKEAILEGSKEWAKGVAKAFASLEGIGALPNDVYVFADAHAQGWFASALARDPLFVTPGQAPIAPLSLTGREMSQLADVRGASPDPYLLSELAFADARLDEGRTLSFAPNRELILTRPRATMNRA